MLLPPVSASAHGVLPCHFQKKFTSIDVNAININYSNKLNHL